MIALTAGIAALLAGLAPEQQPSAATAQRSAALNAPSAATRTGPMLAAASAPPAATAVSRPTIDALAAPEPRPARTLRIAAGDSLYTLFERNALSLASLARLMTSDPLARRLHDLAPGTEVELVADDHGHVLRLRLSVPGTGERLSFERAAINMPFSANLSQAEPDPRPVARRAVVAGSAATAPVATTTRTRVVEVRSGDSLAAIFARQGISPRQLAQLAAAGEGRTLRRIRPGDHISISTEDERLVALEYRPNALRTLRFERQGDAFRGVWQEHELEHRQRTASGVIDSSLFVAGQRAGLSDGLIMGLAEIFGWDIDFALEIRRGDRFSVIYEERFDDAGNRVGDGPILAAEFVNRGHTYRAVRHQFADGHGEYFTPQGLSMRKAFLRTPVNFARISSRFSGNRKHPVLNRIRAHRGVDYAAPRGTPIKASGDGKVAFVGRKGGYGRTVVLRHGGAYSTLYAHMSRFARGLRRGQSVRQGQVIGYVGRSGLATGTHLHYEFRVRGVHRNPLTVKLPKAAPLAADQRDAFRAHSRELLARLDALAITRVAARTN